MSSLRLELPAPVSGRLRAVDELKGLAIILVILYHVGGVLVWTNALHLDVGVDLFVILSGVSLGFSAHYAGAGPFLARRLIRIMPAYWVILTASWVCNTAILHANYTPFDLGLHYLGLQSFLGDRYAFAITDSFWYITLVLILYVLYCACHALLRSPDRLLLAGALIFGAIAFMFFFTYGPTGLYGHLVMRIPGFFGGLLVGRLLRDGRLELRLGPTLGIAAGLLFYVADDLDVVLYSPAVAISLAAIYLFFVKRLAPAPVGLPLARALKFLGDRSLEIFLIHQPLIREYNFYVYARYLNHAAPGTGLLLMGVAGGLAATLLLSTGLHWAFQQIPLPFSSDPAGSVRPVAS
jgi:peptidoglycan/LPS O-acetylase OafA/YrhL